MQANEIFSLYRRVAVVGLSPNRSRPSFGVTQYLIENGFEVFGVRPGGIGSILERPCYERLEEVPKPLEIVDVFRASEHVPGVVEEAIRLQAKAIWLQEGVTHPEAEKQARQAGLLVVSNLCILKAHLKWKRS